MGEYYSHLYTSTQELVDAQNYCALQHLQYFKVFLVKEKRMLQPMKDKDWLTIAKKYNGEWQEGHDNKIKNAYDLLKGQW
ncbi:N-acetylmuramidase domain-containing protein [Rahnella rivi]|uniref:N-acetylmuramidase domain-containing protein n=1 Tax=Rahnella rivi TaxID=2816249 RepID=UPI0039BDCC78